MENVDEEVTLKSLIPDEQKLEDLIHEPWDACLKLERGWEVLRKFMP